MADNKNSFVLYCDIIHTVSKMPKDKIADLFLHILRYVNDENPVTNDILIDLVFEPIKQSLKRDLKRYEAVVIRNQNNGKKGGRPKKEPKKPSGLINNPKNPSEPKKADSDSDSDIYKNIKNILLSKIEISDVPISYSKYFAVAKEFQSLFIQNLKDKNASFAHQENATVGNYVEPIRLLIEKKECTIEELRDVWEYLASPAGEFWKKNILSTSKLRSQITTLVMNARTTKPAKAS